MESDVLKILAEHGQDDERFVAAVEELAVRQGLPVFQAVLFHLSGMNFDRETACRHWRRACLHRAKLAPRVSLRAALLDYLHRVAGEMSDPRLIEARHLAELRHASVTDGLTGLFQQIYFKSFLAREVDGLKRQEDVCLSVVILDLDHFKQYNDRCGHLAGDLALTQVARIIRDCTRPGDLSARYGGEEFILLLPRANRQQAFKVAERIRVEVEKSSFPRQELLDRGNLTISGGIASYPEDGDTAEELIAAADRQLYQAKSHRNVIYPSHEDRRSSHRHKVRSVLEIAEKNGAFHPGLTFDVSSRGIRLGCGLSVSPGSEVHLRFSEPFWPSAHQVTARVRHVQSDYDGRMHLLGLELDPQIDMESFLPERRGGKRHQGLPSLF